ncbi:DUF5808 domain-containing protein [Flavobacterium sp. HJJ]|uniref:DUF5808 domain-containing protein n=1 Tax=Flavobacterium sp. HJJ TaxID=2783792 RepID=UPI00293C0412|nr:DUF5808 domain-containing protein [Flavobacterium sp. HJJ]
MKKLKINGIKIQITGNFGHLLLNPEDRRIFPPKRIKQLGWTINFANPNSVFIILVIIAILCLLGENLNI